MSDYYSEVEHWYQLARRLAGKYPMDELLGEHKRKTHLDLVERWADPKSCRNMLKTDLFEEALGPDHFSFHLAKVNSNIVGMDISGEMALEAKRRSRKYNPDLSGYVCCDVRQLSFKGNSFDLVVSNSTLDHFHNKGDIIVALQELRRVLAPGGIFILTMDNKYNLAYPLRRLRRLVGLSPYFMGETYSLRELKHILETMGFKVEDTSAIIHRPPFFTNMIVRFLRKVSARRLDGVIRKGLAILDRLEKRKTKHLTGLHVAIKAVNCEAV